MYLSGLHGFDYRSGRSAFAPNGPCPVLENSDLRLQLMEVAHCFRLSAAGDGFPLQRLRMLLRLPQLFPKRKR